ncbi:hypothetical protein ACFXPX_33070 [Kitasatospora sp. NPDC059146]
MERSASVGSGATVGDLDGRTVLPDEPALGRVEEQCVRPARVRRS